MSEEINTIGKLNKELKKEGLRATLQKNRLNETITMDKKQLPLELHIVQDIENEDVKLLPTYAKINLDKNKLQSNNFLPIKVLNIVTNFLNNFSLEEQKFVVEIARQITKESNNDNQLKESRLYKMCYVREKDNTYDIQLCLNINNEEKAQLHFIDLVQLLRVFENSSKMKYFMINTFDEEYVKAL